MSYRATVFNVMIGAPSDVAKEWDIIRRAVLDWNFAHSQHQQIVLMPTGWDTHGAPSTRGPAQDVINRHVLDDCDLLVAVFWTRIGSATRDSISGTVEEITRHTSAGKPAMLYFSNVPAHPDTVDQEQISAVRAFKVSQSAQSLFWTYDSIAEFQEVFPRHLV